MEEVKVITYRIIVREHGKRDVIEEEWATGNTERAASASKQAVVRALDWQYPPDLYEIKVERVRTGARV